MKSKTALRLVGLGVLLGRFLTTLHAAPLGSAVSYTGRLQDGSQPATGRYDFQVALYDDATAGVKIGPTLTLPGVGVTNGGFTLALDFEAGAFNGDARWLGVSVRTNGAAVFTLLQPRQPVGPLPYALYAASSPLPLGALTNNATGVSLAGHFSGDVYGTFYGNSFGNWFGNGYGDGSGINNLNASALAAGAVPDARLSSTVARLNANQAFTGSNFFGFAGNRFIGAFAGDGSGLGNLSAASLTGAIPPASIGPGTITSAMLTTAAVGTEQLTPGAVTSAALADGAVTAAKIGGVLQPNQIPDLNAAKLSSGTVSDARLSTNVPLLNASQVFAAENRFAGPVLATNLENQITGTLLGNGSGLIGLDASHLTTGAVSDARLSANVALLNASQVFAAENRFAGPVLATNLENQITGTLLGNGSGLIGLDASHLTTGTVADARLSTNVPLLNASQTFTADNQFAGPLRATNAGNQITGTFLGDGSGLAGVWSLAGNAGTSAETQFLGTTDDQPFEIHVNATRALRIEPNPDGLNLIGGSGNSVNGAAGATIAGGVNNTSRGAHTFVGGGKNNSSANDGTVVCGGEANTLYSGTWATLVGGQENWLELGVWSFLGGGHNNQMYRAYRSVIGGGEGNYMSGFDGDGNFIGGGIENKIEGEPAHYCAIVGGNSNQFGGAGETALGLTGMAIGGGRANSIQTLWDEMHDSVIGGGYGNVVRASRSTIAGGLENVITLDLEAGALPHTTASTIGGGSWNRIESAGGVIAGGSQNSIGTNSDNATIAGGVNNQISANAVCATIPGGRQNCATNQAFAAGTRAQASHSGAFVWADATEADFASTMANQFAVRASGGTRFYSDTNATVGVELAPGANAWSVLSDRNLKENIRPADARRVLEKLNALAVTEWNLKSQAPEVRHLGPMAQDFAQAFRVGEDQHHISTSDADGVAFLAIQGLSQKLEERSQKLEAENAALTREIAELKALVSALAERVNGIAK